MHRRSFLALTGGSGLVATAGCLTRIPGLDLGSSTPPVEGRLQWGYDAGSSDYAAGMSGPSSQPSHQRLYSEMQGIPVITDDTLYTPTAAYSVDGTRQWTQSAPVEGGRLRSAIFEGSIICAGRDPRMVWAQDLADGAEQWRLELPAYRRETQAGASVASMPQQWLTVANEQAYFSTGIGINGVDLHDPTERWHTDLHQQETENPPGFRAPAAIDGQVVTVNRYALHDLPPVVYALDQTNGDVTWTAEIEGDAFAAGPPTAVDDTVYVMSPVNDPPDVEGDHQWTQVTAIDAADGETRWRTAVDGPSEGHVAVGDGTVYVGHGKLNDPPKVTAIDSTDGSIRWTGNTGSRIIFITIAEDRLYVFNSIFLHAIRRSDGETVWEINLIETLEGIAENTDPGLVICPPVVYEDRLFITYRHGVAGLW